MPDSTEKRDSINIGMLLDVDYPPDDRPEKEALSLIEEGYNLYLLCFTSSDKLQIETYKGIHIRRFKISGFLQKKLSAAYLVLPFHRWIWRYQIKKFVRENNIQILHVHDLPLSDVAHVITKKRNIKLIFDQHEYWSNWIGHTAHYNTFLGKIVKRLSNWEEYERKYLPKADLVITVEEPLRKTYIEKIGIHPDRIITIPNTPSESIFNSKNIDQSILDRYKNNFVIFYAGKIDVLRGIYIVIQALPKLSQEIPNIRFVIAGKLAKNCDPIKEARKYGVEKYVDHVGWISVNKLPSYIAASSICTHTPPVIRDETNQSVATKVYQYIAMHKPVIVGEAKLMYELIVKNGVGLSIKNGDSEGYIDQVLRIYKDHELVADFKRNAERLTAKYKWETTVQAMLAGYKNLIPIVK